MNKQVFTPEQIIAALKRNKGMVYLTAESLGCTPNTIYNYMQRYPEVAEVQKSEGERVVDIAELKLYEKVLAGDRWGVGLILQTKGKNRGYVKREEQTGADGQPLNPASQPYDLSKLTDKELEALGAIFAKLGLDPSK